MLAGGDQQCPLALTRAIPDPGSFEVPYPGRIRGDLRIPFESTDLGVELPVSDPQRRAVRDPPERDGARAAMRGGGAPRTVIMCAEAVWWRCHRQLVADALVAAGVQVRHITSEAPAAPHTVTEFARVVDRRVTYPGLL